MISKKKVLSLQSEKYWRGARVVEEARLESVCAPKVYRGFESLPLRKIKTLTIKNQLVRFFYF